MNWKFALALSALVTTVAAHVGCASDVCDQADDQVANCAIPTETPAATSAMGVTQACAGQRLCQSRCINTHSCADITGNLPDYAQCITACQGQSE